MESNKDLFEFEPEVRLMLKKALDALPEEQQSRIRNGDTRGHCGEYSNSLKEVLNKLYPHLVVKLVAARTKDANHNYLIMMVNGQEIIIDPTVNQFLPDIVGVYIGTRERLKEFVLNPDTKIRGTRSSNNPPEAFSRIWGDESVWLSR